jgi:hypothetical protein
VRSLAPLTLYGSTPTSSFFPSFPRPVRVYLPTLIDSNAVFPCQNGSQHHNESHLRRQNPLTTFPENSLECLWRRPEHNEDDSGEEKLCEGTMKC